MSILRMRTKKGGSKQSVQERMMTEKRKGGAGRGRGGINEGRGHGEYDQCTLSACMKMLS
jgi:hypothetical protein